MKVSLTQSQVDFTLAFDYPNLIVGNYIPFLWDLNTNLWNNEGRLWNYTGQDNFYIKLVSQYTHKEYILYGDIDLTNNRYTQATFDVWIGGDYDDIDEDWDTSEIDWEYKGDTFILEGADDGFYYTYFIIESDSQEAVVIYETLTYITIEGNKPTFISNISDNEDRKIIYAN